ncbi:MAG: MFS transporter [Nocardioides sp.]
MTRTETRQLPTGWGDRLGLPPVVGRGLFVSSTVVDALANGLVFAFLVVYFDRVTDLSLETVGLALTVGRLVAMPVPAIVGPLLDRYGSKTLVVVSNVLSCAGMTVCAVTTNAWQVMLAQMLLQAGTNVYWTSSRDLVATASAGQHRSRWFALLGALRNLGTGFGSAATAIALATASDTGLRILVALSGAAFVLAALLLVNWTVPRSLAESERRTPDSAPDSAKSGSYGQVLRDVPYLRLLVVNLAYVLAAMALPVLVVLWTVDYVGVSPWWAGVLVVVNTTLIVLLSTIAVRFTEHHPPRRMLRVGLVLNAISFVLFWAAGEVRPAIAVTTLVLAMLVYTLGEMISTPYMNDLTVALAPPEEPGRHHAAFQLSWSLGMAVAPALFTALLTVGPEAPWLVMIAISLVVLPLCRGLNPH